MSSQTRLIQRKIYLYTVSFLLVMAIIITAIALIPMYRSLRRAEEKGLIFARDSSVLIIDAYISRIKDVARQISSRTKARILLQDYNAGKISHADMKLYLDRILDSALKSSTQLRAIRRFDQNGHELTAVGVSIDQSMQPNSLITDKLVTHGPFNKAGHSYLTLLSPIYTPAHKYVGADLLLFDITNLQNNIYQKIQNRLGQIILAYKDGQKIRIFNSVTQSWASQLIQQPKLLGVLESAIRKNTSGMASRQISNDKIFIAYSPIHHMNWGVGVIIKQKELFASIQTILRYIVLTIVVVSALWILVLLICLRPLSGRILMHTNELETEIEKGKQALSKANEKLQHLVDHDFLTGLVSRRGFHALFSKALAHAKRHQKQLLVAYIDINQFKQINDQLGHDMGDEILQDLGRRLKQAFREEDIIARLGGDEFVLIVLDADEAMIPAMINKIKGVTDKPFISDGQLINYSISVGLAHYPHDAQSLDGLLQASDVKMYQDKHNH
jgi:diguanylate cyclase (GGDEF)-like protein